MSVNTSTTTKQQYRTLHSAGLLASITTIKIAERLLHFMEQQDLSISELVVKSTELFGPANGFDPQFLRRIVEGDGKLDLNLANLTKLEFLLKQDLITVPAPAASPHEQSETDALHLMADPLNLLQSMMATGAGAMMPKQTLVALGKHLRTSRPSMPGPYTGCPCPRCQALRAIGEQNIPRPDTEPISSAGEAGVSDDEVAQVQAEVRAEMQAEATMGPHLAGQYGFGKPAGPYPADAAAANSRKPIPGMPQPEVHRVHPAFEEGQPETTLVEHPVHHPTREV